MIRLYPHGRNFKLVVKIGRQPTVVYNELSIEEVIKFINSHNEFIDVTAYVSNGVYSRLQKEIANYYVQLELGVNGVN